MVYNDDLKLVLEKIYFIINFNELILYISVTMITYK